MDNMKKKFLIYILVIFWSLNIHSQDTTVYHTSLNLDLPIISAGLLLNSYALVKTNAIEKPTTEQLVSWSRTEVPAWERSATYQWSERAADWSDIVQVAAAMAPLTLLGSDKIRSDIKSVGMMYAEAFLLNQGLISSIKSTVKRRRPYVFNEEVNYELKYRKQVFFSFVSGHTMSSASMTFLTAKIYSDFYPDSNYKNYIWAGAIAIPAITGYLRYKAGRHFYSDLMVGYGLGAITGIFIPELHKAGKNNHFQGSITGIADGMGIRLTVDF